jgi:TolB-like protein
MQLPRQLEHYRLQHRLGRGGMGEVYQAHDTRLGREVAIKLLPPELAKDPIRRKRFERESKALAALNHPNIVTVHAIEEGEGQPFLVMELVDGHTLRRHMPVGGLPLARALELILPVVHAVAAAHRAHIVHRDLKPENVMVRRDGMIKVVDFGISKMEQTTLAAGLAGGAMEALTQEGVVMGTVHYVPPEYLEGRVIGPSGDVFALGVVLYEMTSGEKPFAGHSDLSVVSSILRDTPRLLDPRSGKLPKPLVPVLERCLAKDPAGRYADAGELASALEALRASVTVAEERQPRRRRQAIAASLSLLVLVVAALAWLWTRSGAPSQAAGGAATRAATAPKPRGDERGRPTIAVLPLQDLAGGDQAHFAEGSTEALTAKLASIGSLRVISQGSAQAAFRRDRALTQVAADLGARYLVQGSIARDASKGTTMIVQLIDAQSGETLWGDTRQGSLHDVLGFQGEVATAISRRIEAPVSAAERARIARQPAVDEPTYELYLRGRHLLGERTPESIQKALALFQGVASSAPRFAPAWVGIAEANQLLGSVGYAVESSRQAIPRAEAAAKRALELDPDSSEAWATLAYNRVFAWQWPEAEKAFGQALALNPSDALARQHYSLYLTAMGRHREALAQVAQARQLDPLSRAIAQAEAAAAFFAGDYPGTLASADASLQRYPKHWFFELIKGDALSMLGRYPEAAASFEKALALGHSNPLILAAAGVNQARMGDTAAARQTLEELERARQVGYVPPTLLAKVCFALGDREDGIRWLETAVEERDASLGFLAVDPDFRDVIDEPEVRAIAARVGLNPS